MLRTVIEAGHGRTAAKLRSYLGAAYAPASRAVLLVAETWLSATMTLRPTL